jgi:sulfatase maturation enzyme AslB (radical SAM superfamily)
VSDRRKNGQADGAGIPQGIHVGAKPIGPMCNLNCEYCFYLERQALFDEKEKYWMSYLGALILAYKDPTRASVCRCYSIIRS